MSEDSIRILEANSDCADPDTATPVKVQRRPKEKGKDRGSGRNRVKAEVRSQVQPLLDSIRPQLRSYVQLVDSQDTWSTPHMAQAIARMAESGRAKVKELLARHSELEQSETKAQGALVTILSLTQITELKLLLDIGRMGHRFYEFVLTLLIACISLEIFVGMIIIYIGNLHYYQASTRGGWCYDIMSCIFCCCRPCRWPKRNGIYLSVGSVTGAREPLHSQRSHVSATHPDDEDGGGCCEWPAEPRVETLIDLERADSNIEVARVKVADADVKIVRANNYVKVVEDALKRSTGNQDLEEELSKSREELSAALREKEEAEAEQKLAEAQQHHAFFIKEQHEDRQERITFRKVSFWQHMATYLLYFVMLMNVFITTFGISGGRSNTVINNDSFHTGNITNR